MAKLYVVMEKDEDNIPTIWDTAFTVFQDAASAVEAHHQQLWHDCAMVESFGEVPELEVLPEEGENSATIMLPFGSVSWPSWYVKEVTA